MHPWVQGKTRPQNGDTYSAKGLFGESNKRNMLSINFQYLHQQVGAHWLPDIIDFAIHCKRTDLTSPLVPKQPAGKPASSAAIQHAIVAVTKDPQ